MHYAPSHCPPFSVHEEVVGAVLTQDGWVHMPAAAKAQAASDLAAFLNALHELPVSVGLKCGLMQLDAKTYAQTLHETVPEVLYPLLDRETQKALDAVLTQWSDSAAGKAQSDALLHCDLAPGHLLCNESTGHLTGIIDFGDIAIGPPARDFIYIYEDYGPELLAHVLSHYANCGDVPSLRSEMKQWCLLEAIAWTLNMLVRHRHVEARDGIKQITYELVNA